MKYTIELDQTDRFLVALIKNHFPKFTKGCKGWNEVMLKAFSGIYRYDFDNSYSDQFHVFQKLFSILEKISENKQYDLQALFKCIFNPHSFRQGTALEKGIGELCGLIQCTIVKNRYSLYIKPETKKRFYENTKDYKISSDN